MFWIKALFGLLSIFGVCRLAHHTTEGFRISKIQNNTFENEEFPAGLSFSAVEEKRVKEILSQPFTYLARGKQSFVFVSEDQKTVLKLLNNHYQWRIHAHSLLPNIPWKEENLSYFEKKMKMTYQSYLLAFSQMREETGVFFLHLKKSDHLKQKVKIVDKLGIAHEVDLDKTAFILQERATLAYTQFAEWIEKKDISTAKAGISSILDLLKTRLEREISDRDPLIRTNIGFIAGKAHFLDLGPFSKNFIQKTPSEQRQELQKITHSLKLWLTEKEPSLAEFLDEELSKAL